MLILEHGGYILRGRQNTPDDGFAQGHFGSNMTVKQFLGHIAVVIQIPHVGGSQSQQLCLWTQRQQLLRAVAPILGTSTVELIEYNISGVLRSDFLQLRGGTANQLGVGVKADVLQRKIRVLPQQAFALGLKDILTWGKPYNYSVGVILDQLKSDIAFSGSRGVNDGGLTVLLHHFDCRLVGFCIVFKQLQRHPVSPLPERYSIFIMEDSRLLKTTLY